jgi:hypothetical protein
VVSGYTADNRIFYRKTMLACGGRKWHNLELSSPVKMLGFLFTQQPAIR